MAISVYFAPLNDNVELVTQLLVEEFQLNDSVAKNLATNVAKTHFDRLNGDTFLVAESLYIDRVEIPDYVDPPFRFMLTPNSGEVDPTCVGL